ncbi:MAG: GTPase ObgE, partial [Clostridia bacterium]|nr:GTPase ObgE [Clostridia bacterium]
MFIDRVKISIKAGDGGHGITSFLHFKGVVNGGPDGGDGGKGGDVIMRADSHVNSLIDYYYKTKYTAGDGGNGEPKNCFGKAGDDLILSVPLGTVVKDEETGNIICDFFYDGQEKVLLKGGDGGKGNAHRAHHRPGR